MDGQRLAVKEVRGATDDLQLVDKCPGGFLRFKVNGKAPGNGPNCAFDNS